MEKTKLHRKGDPPTTQKHLHSRVSFLYRAAAYFAGLSAENQVGGRRSPAKDAYDCDQSQGRQEKASLLNLSPTVTQNKLAAIELPQVTASPRGGSPAVYHEANARMLLSHVKGISRKSRKGQVRVSRSMKHTICRRCDILLIEGRNATKRVENQSRGGKKPWADVVVITCNACGSAKYIPIGLKRQLRRKDRPVKPEEQRHPEATQDNT